MSRNDNKVLTNDERRMVENCARDLRGAHCFDLTDCLIRHLVDPTAGELSRNQLQSLLIIIQQAKRNGPEVAQILSEVTGYKQ